VWLVAWLPREVPRAIQPADGLQALQFGGEELVTLPVLHAQADERARAQGNRSQVGTVPRGGLTNWRKVPSAGDGRSATMPGSTCRPRARRQRRLQESA
jgi:hypothetical protein